VSDVTKEATRDRAVPPQEDGREEFLLSLWAQLLEPPEQRRLQLDRDKKLAKARANVQNRQKEGASITRRNPGSIVTYGEPMASAAQQALQKAQAEGLTLAKANRGALGYFGVTQRRGLFLAQPGRYLGAFATAEEAALAVARTPEGRAAAAAQAAMAPMTSNEALKQAQAEGLTLQRTHNSSGVSSTGFKYVTRRPLADGNKKGKPNQVKPYLAQVAKRYLGAFTNAEEAALAVARHVARAATGQAAAT
jgi:hypothetical protein